MAKQIVVVGAVIMHDGKVLCARRAADATLPGMWEFPGGKVEPSESPTTALEREIAEELDCSINVGPQVTQSSYAYDFGTVHLTTYYCSLTAGEPMAKEHAELIWLPPDELGNLEWAPADVPAVTIVQAARLDETPVVWADRPRAPPVPGKLAPWVSGHCR